MNKTQYIIVAIVIIVGVGLLLFGRNAEAPRIDQTNSDGDTMGDQMVSGSIRVVDTTAVALDGPIALTIETAQGEERIIHVPSMGIRLCAAYEQIADPFELHVGDVVEVKGSVASDNTITPCESPDHYLRVETQ